MGRGIQAALAALGARGTGANWSLDLATLDLSSVFGGALAGEAVVDVTSEEALAFRQPAELAALGSLWVPGLESAEALAVAICEAHESLRVRLENDLETLARLGIDARLALPIAHARGTLQIGDDDVAVEIDDAGELVITHIGAARVQAGQGRALGAPEDTEADEALVRITRVVQRVRERGLLEGAPIDDDQGIDVGVGVDVDLDLDEGPAEGEAAASAGSAWVEDEHTQSIGERAARADTKHLSDEQLAAVHEALSEESDAGDALDVSDEAEPIDDPLETAPLLINSTATGPPDVRHPMVADDEEDIRTVSISIRQQSSLLRAFDALGKQADEPLPTGALVDDGTATASMRTVAAGAGAADASDGDGDEQDGEESDGEDDVDDADRTVTVAAAPPPVSMASMPDLPEGSDDGEAQPTVVLAAPLRHSAEAGGAMPAPTAAVEPVNARIPSDEIESIARGFDEGNDIDEGAGAVAPVPAPDDAGDDTAGFQFDRPPVVYTLDDAPPATNATVSQPAEPAVPGPSMEESSADELPVDESPAAASPVADDVADAPPAEGIVDSLALLPPDDQPPATRDFRVEAEGFDDSADEAPAPRGTDEGADQEGATAGAAFDGAGAGPLEPADTAAINLPAGLPGTVAAGPAVRSDQPAAPPAIFDDGDDDEPKTRPFRPSDMLGLLKRTTDQDDPTADPDTLEARADALEAEARELRERAGALRARRAAVTVVPHAPLSWSRSETSTTPGGVPPPPVLEDASASASSLPSLPSVEVHAIEVPSDEEGDSFAVAAPLPARPHNSAEEGVSLAEVRAALGSAPDDSTHVGVVEAPVELRAPFPSAESDVFANADAEQPSSADAADLPVMPRSIVLVVEDARARDRLKRHLSPRFDELFEAADATSAIELPNISRLAALVFVRPRPDEKTRFGLEHLETLARRPRVLVISSDVAFDQMPSVDHRLPLGQRASEVAQQVIDGLTALGVPLHDA